MSLNFQHDIRENGCGVCGSPGFAPCTWNALDENEKNLCVCHDCNNKLISAIKEKRKELCGKPPLGVKPKWLLDELRFDELVLAIARRIHARQSRPTTATVPDEWRIELAEVSARIVARQAKQNAN